MLGPKKCLPHVIYKVSRPYKKERQTQAVAPIDPRRPKGSDHFESAISPNIKSRHFVIQLGLSATSAERTVVIGQRIYTHNHSNCSRFAPAAAVHPRRLTNRIRRPSCSGPRHQPFRTDTRSRSRRFSQAHNDYPLDNFALRP